LINLIEIRGQAQNGEVTGQNLRIDTKGKTELYFLQIGGISKKKQKVYLKVFLLHCRSIESL
jgi:hypothetical protein